MRVYTDMPRSISPAFIGSRWSFCVLLAASLALWFALWVFSEIVDDTPKGKFVGWDEPVLKLIRGTENTGQGSALITGMARSVTWLGSSVFLTALSTVALIWLARQHSWRSASVLFIAAMGSLVVMTTLKWQFVRARPSVVTHLVDEKSWSFPSGHALCSAAIYIVLSVLLAGRLSTRWRQAAVVAAAFFLSFLIGLSRIYLGVHYPTDVLAGWSAGTAWAILCAGGLAWWEHHARFDTPPVRDKK